MIIAQNQWTIDNAHGCRRGRYWITSARCTVWIRSLPARSAMVRASFRIQRTLEESAAGTGAHVQLLHGGAEQALAGVSRPE
jgi:hypothetical protein